jgi:tRNA (cmo5U34)-methyltransferase
LVKNIQPDVRVWLDSGCGSGTLVLKAAPIFPQTLFLLADPSEKMLEQARIGLQHIAPKRLRFLKPSGSECITLSNMSSPQVITAIQAHHYLSKKGRQQATQRCFDLLEPGGLYITFENVRPATQPGIEYGLTRWKRYQIAQGRAADVVEAHGKRFDMAYFPITIAEHLQLLQQCGFSVAEMFWYSHMQAGFYGVKM